MFQILRCVLVFFIAASMVNFSVAKRTAPAATIAKAFETHRIVPDVVERAPFHPIFVKYRSGAVVKQGNQLTPAKVKDVPTVMWDANPLEYYTLAMIDPDAPSRAIPKHREWQHWLVGNILGNVVATGDTLSSYVGPSPPQGTGLHRYVFLVFKQPGRLQFNEQILSGTSPEYRGGFSITMFAAKYGLNDPVAGNLFLAQFQDRPLGVRI